MTDASPRLPASFASSGFRRLTFLAASIALFLAFASTARAISSTIVISQVYGGAGCATAGCSTYQNDYIELKNLSGSSQSLNGMSVQYASATGTTWQVTSLPNVTLSPGQFFLIAESFGANGVNPLPTPDATGTIFMSATAAKVALVSNTTALSGACPTGATIIDFVGYGTATCFEGSGTAPAPSTTTADFRAGNGCTDTDSNSSDFSTAAPSPRNTASSFSSCVATSTNPSGSGASNPSLVAAGGTTLLTVTVSPGTNPASTGLAVTADLTAIGGSATQQFFDDGTNGDVTPGNNVFSFQATVAAGTSGGGKTLPVSITDAQARTGSASIPLSVTLSPPTGNLVISQIYGGGGNTGATLKNDFIELYNRGNAAINLSGYSVQYSSATGTGAWQVTSLSGSIGPGQNYLVQEAAGTGGTTNLPTPDATGTIAMSATAGKVALASSTTALTGGCPSSVSILDFIGYGSTANCFEGSGAAPTLTNTTAALRNADGCTDTNNNTSDFSTGAPNPRNTASPAHFCGGPTNPTGVGSATPSAVDSGQTSLLKVAVTPGSNPPSSGITVTANLSSIGGSASQAFFDDGSNGDVTAGDNVFSYLATVTGTGGVKTLPFTIADAELRSGSGSISLTINPSLIAIHDIQGSGTTSPHNGELVATIGVVTGVKSNGFFIQSADGFVDADPNTSEGIFVFTGSAPPGAAAVGNDVKVTGTVQEFIPSQDLNSPPTTEISGSVSVSVLPTGNPLPAAITLTAGDTSAGGSIEQLERYEGMRVHVASLTVIAPTQGSIDEPNATSTSNGVFYGVITGIARPFREPGVEVPDPLPPGSPCCVPSFDANPERLRVDSDGLVGATALEVTTGAVVTNLTGPLDYGFRTYTIDPDPAPPPVATGNISAVPVPDPNSSQFTVASFNMQRFYDTVNDPGDVVLTATAFNNRLNKASLAIRNVLKTPDILGVQEMENLVTLQALATKVNNDAVAAGQPNPNYQAYLEEGNDIGGIDVGFLVKGPPRVNVIDVTQYNKDETYFNPNNNQPELLNDRPSLILRATVQPPVGSPYPITVIVNHLRSLSGVDDPVDGNRVRTKRRAQAESLANLVQTRQTADPNEHIVLVGDFNAFEFNDGYVDSIGTIKGTPTPCDQVVLCSLDLVTTDLVDLVDTVPAAERYSYSFDGNAQVLDHELITQNLLPRFDVLRYARNDADFPESFRNDPNRPERISDHDLPVAYFSFPPQVTALSPAKVWVGLTNSDDVGIKFDLKAEVYKGATLIGSGSLTSVPGGSSGFNNAKLNSIPLTVSTFADVSAGDILSIKVFERNACTGSGKNSGRARLWYNGQPVDSGPTRDAGSRFDATVGIDEPSQDYYLRGDFQLDTTAGSSKKSIDKSAGAKCSAFQEFGTWSLTF